MTPQGSECHGKEIAVAFLQNFAGSKIKQEKGCGSQAPHTRISGAGNARPATFFRIFPLWVSSEGMGSRLWVSSLEMLRAATKLLWVTVWIILYFGQNREIMRK